MQRVFGGQVAGQALVAAGRTVPADRPVHSLHAYFIRPGDPCVPIVYTVDRVRDGRSFTTRRVSAIQHGKVIFTLSASFHRPEPGPQHAVRMPEVPPPDQMPSVADRLEKVFGPHSGNFFRSRPIDLRFVGPLTFEAERDPKATAPVATPVAAVTTSTTTSTTKATKSTATPKPQKVKREKVRFGQAPRNALPAGPQETATGSDVGAGAASAAVTPGGTMASTAGEGRAIAPLENAPSSDTGPNPLDAQPAPTGKTRYSARAKEVSRQ